MLFYIDGQSIGNEQKGQPRKARIAIVYQLSSSPSHDASNARVLAENLGDKTNNEAEYHALIRLLSLLSASQAGKMSEKMHGSTQTVRILSDSKLLVNQVNGEWKVEEERLNKLREEARGLIDGIGSVTLEWVPRERNYAGLWLEGKWTARQTRAEEFLSDTAG